MTRNSIFAVSLATIIAAMVVLENNTLSKLRLQNESLHAEKEEIDRLIAENRDLPKLRTATAAFEPMSRSETSELLRLRNEVGPLRAQKQEVEKLRSENQHLVADLKSGKITPRKLAQMEGFVAREGWTHTGFATPEATIQSYLWAMSTANVDQLLQCLTPEGASQMERIQRNPERFQKQLMTDDNPFREVVGFRIAERKTLAENRVLLGVQVAADGEVLPLTLRRIGNEWKLEQL